jgi:hypothetical protein
MNRKLVGLVFSIAALSANAAAQTVTGSGTANTVPVFTGTSTLGNSPVSVSGRNVGIGTTSPQATLEVLGNVMVGNPAPNCDSPSGIEFYSGISSVLLDCQQNIYLLSGATINTNSQPVAQTTTPTGLWIQNNGLFVIADNSQTPGASYNPSIRLAINSNGDVGIGTSNPTEQLDLLSNVQSTGYEEFTRFKVTNNSSGSFSRLLLGQASTNTLFIETADQNNNKGTTAIQPYGGAVAVGLPGSPSSLTVTGNVGIGTTNPGAKLEVNGGITLTSGSNGVITFQDGTQQTTAFNPTLCGGDYAESVDATGDRSKYEPGDVLVIATDEKGDVVKSSEAYSTLVAGIYSTKPGLTGRRQLSTKRAKELPMAMVGIVPTKVSAENGPIRKGDLLVTSGTEAYAMKGTDRSRMLGAVIGKAMGSLDSGKGVIEVLVTLQ